MANDMEDIEQKNKLNFLELEHYIYMRGPMHEIMQE